MVLINFPTPPERVADVTHSKHVDNLREHSCIVRKMIRTHDGRKDARYPNKNDSDEEVEDSDYVC